ncbi:MAG TPA: lysylphosphatidylglycerol synthase transmembrane domain-containing protein [Streptosporangiaceae bacterium]|jgi:hypothetical protein
MANVLTRHRWLGRHPLRWVLLVVTLTVAGVFLAPRASEAVEALHHLRDASPLWLLVALLAEAVSLLAFSLGTRRLIQPGFRPPLGRVIRLDLVSIALSHAVPAGSAAGTALGYELLEEEGVPPVQSGVVKVSQSLLSTVLLQVLLGVSLALTLVVQGPSDSNLALTALGAVLLLFVVALVWMLAYRPQTVRKLTVRVLSRFHRGYAEKAGDLAMEASRQIRALLHAPRQLLPAAAWSLANWGFDYLSLWASLRAFGVPTNPILLFEAFCVAQVVASLPISPAGLGVVEGSLVPLLIAFGTTQTTAILGVLAWRLFNYWLPLPAGAAAYGAILADRHRRARTDQPAGTYRPQPTAMACAKRGGHSSDLPVSVPSRRVDAATRQHGDAEHVPCTGPGGPADAGQAMRHPTTSGTVREADSHPPATNRPAYSRASSAAGIPLPARERAAGARHPPAVGS